MAEVSIPSSAFPPGYRYDKTTITANGTSTQTVVASATTIITGGAISPGAGVAIRVVVQAAAFGNNSNVSCLNIWRAIDGGTAVDLGQVGQIGTIATTIRAELEDTPGAGSIVYTVRMWVSGGTGTLYAGAGGAGATYTPASLSVYKV